MKKFLSFSLLGVLAAGAASAQPAITFAKHGLRVGDVHKTLRVANVEPGVTGANVTWDFSASVPTGNVFDEALESADGRVAVRNSNNVVFQFDVTPYGNDYYGYAINGYSVVYEKPILKTRYPFAYLDQHSGEYTGYVEQGASKVAITGTYSSEVDGSGTLKLPNGVTFNNALRVKTTEVQKHDGYTLSEVKYLWYTQQLRYPVFVIINNGTEHANGQKSTSTSTHISVAALEALPAEPELVQPEAALPEVVHSVYPNPVITETTISYTLPADATVSVAVYNLSGACVRKLAVNEPQAAGVHTYTFAPETAGVYFVRFALGDKVYVEQIVKK
jgi:hypothetical protein